MVVITASSLSAIRKQGKGTDASNIYDEEVRDCDSPLAFHMRHPQLSAPNSPAFLIELQYHHSSSFTVLSFLRCNCNTFKHLLL